MSRFLGIAIGLVLTSFAMSSKAAEKDDLAGILGRQTIGPQQTQKEVEDYVEARIPRMPQVKTFAEWERHANRIRAEMFEKVVYRGEAAKWRDAECKVEWLDTINGGPGYKIKKLRYEAVPGLWIPALLYEPEKLSGKVPVILNVNGHDGNGKAAVYKQIRCINLAKRGMLVLNPEWLGMGQLRTDGYHHGRMNQLDLCGTSGLAPFYDAMRRGLDLLLAHENADPARVAVSGLSGGGWQTIYISSLDTRVKLCNPVAGYSSFITRVHHHKDLGDSEQTPCDMATVADYTHFTGLMAPRATLLTYNVADDCCFEAGYALPPLLLAASPIFKLYDKPFHLRAHINHYPGTHNYQLDNRQAFYRMVGDHFYPGDKTFDATEIPSEKEVKKAEELKVEVPAKNADFHSLAVALSKNLPPDVEPPTDKAALEDWQKARRAKLREIVRAKDYTVKAEKAGNDEKGKYKVTYWKLKMGDAWTVPAIEIADTQPKGTAIVLADAGGKGLVNDVQRALDAGQRVLVIDPLFFGESRIPSRAHLFALLLATVGDRPLGIQASQIAATARWAKSTFNDGMVSVSAKGPRLGTAALVAAALDPKAVGKPMLDGSLESLKQVIDKNWTVEQAPELFCFGLLEEFDIKQIRALGASP